jgi:hypothetical protein
MDENKKNRFIELIAEKYKEEKKIKDVEQLHTNTFQAARAKIQEIENEINGIIA